jgi:hypothetical protein
MNLKELKFEPLDSLTQIIIFDQTGAILESDETLVKIKGASANLFEDTMFCGMEEEFKKINIGNELTFDCINTDLYGRESHYDFIVKRLPDDKGLQYGLIIYDFGMQYNKVFELQQERNLAEIQAKKMERGHRKAVEEKETIERLYKELQDGNSSEYILIKADNLLFNVGLNEIYYLEAYGDYIKVHTDDKVYVTLNTMKNVEALLPQNRFIRVHRSFIVQLNKIGNIEQMSMQIKDKVIPIGKSYKMLLIERMKQL